MGKGRTIDSEKGLVGTAAPERIADPEMLNQKLGVTVENRLARKVDEIIGLLWLPEHLGQAEVNARLARAIELYESLAPADGAEAMLAQQMVGTHHAAMECLTRANLPHQSLEGRDMALRQATKLMALYEKQLKTLNTSRGKGQQKVTVEHVHVSDGGQAIVGNVEAGRVACRREAASDPKTRTPEALDHTPEVPVDLAARTKRKARRRS